MPHAPDHLCELTQGEHMLLWTFRAAVVGRADSELIRRQFREACGPVAPDALNAIVVFVAELGRQGRRKVRLALPGSFRLTRDEQLVLALFAAAQADDYPRLEAHIAWLAARPVTQPFAAAACLVAQAFAMNGLILRTPRAAEGPAEAWESGGLLEIPAEADGVIARLPARQAR